jgi:hypothetical protein
VGKLAKGAGGPVAPVCAEGVCGDGGFEHGGDDLPADFVGFAGDAGFRGCRRDRAARGEGVGPFAAGFGFEVGGGVGEGEEAGVGVGGEVEEVGGVLRDGVSGVGRYTFGGETDILGAGAGVEAVGFAEFGTPTVGGAGGEAGEEGIIDGFGVAKAVGIAEEVGLEESCRGGEFVGGILAGEVIEGGEGLNESGVGSPVLASVIS